ncbi:MAG TPA: choice-of-anchor Q domain-containing protein [Solirubrobacteraceae bacterium]|nr:choice-of-anchor Q domain-containing protein [Solirubrobacteraceae bacterium]
MRRTLMTAVVFGVLAAPASATDYVVDTNVDPVSPDLVCTTATNGCTLRDALDDAGPGDRVIVPANTYSLAQGGPMSPNGEQIVGAGARTTILDAGGTGKAVEMIDASSVISGVTLRNGGGQAQTSGSGGAVYVESDGFAPASLTLRSVTVSGSRTSIPAGGSGGGIASVNATLTIENSTITGNLASIGVGSFGGGVVVSGGTATIRNSTISGNTARDTDGDTAQGGGIYNDDGTLTLQNVTIAGNTANTATGLWSNGPTTVTNTLIADTCFGAPYSGSRNLSTSTTCGFGAAVNPLLGALLNNGGQTDTRALQAGSPAINTGASCPTTDQRGVAREGACDIGAYEYRTPVEPPEELPPPVPHKNVNALPKSGTVKIKLPGQDTFVTLTEGEQIPLGTTVDTRKGRVTIVAAAGSGQTADFYDGLFKLTQTKGSKPITVLTLVEKLTGCKSKKKASAAATKKKKRRLWGNGKGRFRTKGKHSAATVVGTIWLVEDRCVSTLTRVRRGKVKVRDFAKKKTVTVRKGKRYIARAGG